MQPALLLSTDQILMNKLSFRIVLIAGIVLAILSAILKINLEQDSTPCSG